jgi:hypothetical protein
VDQATEIVTGIPAGERDEEGNFPEGSINQLVQTRLIELAKKQRAFAAPPEKAGEEEEVVEEEEGEA